MIKVLSILYDANNNIFRNKIRSFLTILAIFVGSFAIISTSAVRAGLNNFIDSQVNAYGGEGLLIIASSSTIRALGASVEMNGASSEPVKYDPDSSTSLTTPISKDKLEKIKSVKGIDQDSVKIQRNATVEYVKSDQNDDKYLMQLHLLPQSNVNIATTAGRKVDSDSSALEISIPQSFVSVLGFKNDEDAIGKTLNLVTKDQVRQQFNTIKAKIVGVQAPGVVMLNYAFINQSLMDTVYAENTKYYPPASRDAVYTVSASYDFHNYRIEDIRQGLSDLGLEAMTVKDIVGQIKSFFDVVIFIFSAFGYIGLLAAAIGIINTLFMSVQERTREIGLNKALGMSSIRVFFTFALEAMLLGFWGSLLGLAISMLAGFSINNIVHQPGALFASFPTYSFVAYNFNDIAPVIIMVMIIAFLAGTVPAIKAARKNPIDALRYE